MDQPGEYVDPGPGDKPGDLIRIRMLDGEMYYYIVVRKYFKPDGTEVIDAIGDPENTPKEAP